MALTQTFAVLLTLVAFTCADIEKLSNYIIRNNSETYVYGPSGYSDHLLHIYRIASTTFDEVLPNNLPTWARMTKEIHPTPDVNYLDGIVVVYFTAMRTGSQTTAIGVAYADQFSLPQGFYSTTATPLEEEKLANLTSPTLLASANSSPQLLFIDTTNRKVDEVSLTPNGLQVLGEKRTLLQPTLDWENGRITSLNALEYDGMYYVLYTAADGVTVGAARSSHPQGPFEKKKEPVGKVLSRSAGVRTLEKNALVWGEDNWPSLRSY